MHSTAPIEPPASSPLRRLFELYFRPTAFFASIPRGRATVAALAAVYVIGISLSMGRVDRMLLQQDLGRPPSGLTILLADSWPVFWGVVLGFGAISAAASWYFGGWWYRMRLRWSGVPDATPEDTRLLFTYSNFVGAFPSLIYTVLCTIIYQNYGDAWASEEAWSILLLIFPFWGIATSYRGLNLWYAPAQRTRARIWFVILPIVVYLLVFGLVATLFSMLMVGDGVAA